MFLCCANKQLYRPKKCILICMQMYANATFGQLGRPTLVEKALSFNHELSSFLSFYQSTVLSSSAVDGHQTYFGGSVNNWSRDLAYPFPLIFTGVDGVKKCGIWRRFQHHSTLNRLQQSFWTLKQKCSAAMIALCPRQVWWSWVHEPLRTRTPPPKLHGENVPNCQ